MGETDLGGLKFETRLSYIVQLCKKKTRQRKKDSESVNIRQDDPLNQRDAK